MLDPDLLAVPVDGALTTLAVDCCSAVVDLEAHTVPLRGQLGEMGGYSCSKPQGAATVDLIAQHAQNLCQTECNTLPGRGHGRPSRLWHLRQRVWRSICYVKSPFNWSAPFAVRPRSAAGVGDPELNPLGARRC